MSGHVWIQALIQKKSKISKEEHCVATHNNTGEDYNNNNSSQTQELPTLDAVTQSHTLLYCVSSCSVLYIGDKK